jgi:hypothetical protein
MQDELLLDWTEFIHVLLFLLRQNMPHMQYLSTCFVSELSAAVADKLWGSAFAFSPKHFALHSLNATANVHA